VPRWKRVIRSVVLAAAVYTTPGCSRQDAQLQQHKEAFESLGATTEAIGRAWLSGAVSGTYTRTALAQTLLLVEQERTALTAAPAALADPRGAALSQQAEKLSRLIAGLISDVRDADGQSARIRLASVPIKPGPESR
jgi:hypothetical protein